MNKRGSILVPPAPKLARAALQRRQANPAIRERAEEEAPPLVHDVLASTGSPLDQTLQDWIAPVYGRDFSFVRVHHDASAAESARQVGALAYTVGPHVVFGADQYKPFARAGRELIAHELAHVMQQESSAFIPESLAISGEGEHHADLMARAAVQRQPLPGLPVPLSGVALARKDSPEDIAAKKFGERIHRIKSLLSYGLFDWAITDAEAIEAFQILKAMSGPERSRAFKVIRLDRLINNLPDKFQPELATMVAESGGEERVTTEITKILTYSFFDWIGSVSEQEAIQAMGLLEALPEDQRDRTLDRIPRQKRRRLHDALPQKGRQRFLQMWSQKEQRRADRQLDEMHQLERGEQLLVRVLLKDSQAPLEAFAPEGVATEVDQDGMLYYGPLELFVSVAGRTRSEAEAALAAELTAKTGTPISVQLKRPPAGYVADFFEAAPRKKTDLPAAPSAAPEPEPKPDPLFDRQQEFRAVIIQEGKRLHAMYEQVQKETKNEGLRKEVEKDQEAFNRLYTWFEKNENSPNLLKVRPAEMLGGLRATVTGEVIKQTVAKQMREQKEAKAVSPEALQARIKKNDEFLNLALSLRGESARKYPYSIPVDEEGIDILVTGAPARQSVLNDIAAELMGWSREHMLDDNYASTDPKDILVYILKSGYEDALKEADKEAVQSEVIDRHEIIPGKALEAFGKTVAVGLIAIAVVGAAVGLGIISGGVALVILGGLALYAGISSYMERRKEIEEKGYDVPIPVTMVHAAGDAIGVSQLVEGITGERLGIGERLKSRDRSDQLGTGGGSLALLLLGSRAFRFGQGAGRTIRLSAPPAVPQTLEGVKLDELGGQYAKPQPLVKPAANPNPGPLEARARAALPERPKVGFDKWIQEMRNNPKQRVDVEKVLDKMSQEQIEKVSNTKAEPYYKALAEAERVQEAKSRSAGDPLRPRLAHNEWKDGITIHYEKVPPLDSEIAHAQAIQARTGEPVHLFGDTPSGRTYPGIDGTIGEPPRPLQLKDLPDAAGLRKDAATALEKVSERGYNKADVHIRVANRTVSELKAAWEAQSGKDIGWETKLRMARDKLPLARLIIEGKDGTWVVEAPPSSPNLPAVPIPAGSRDDKTPVGGKK